MPEAAFPPVRELLPHRGRAVLLGAVLAHDATTTVCSVDPAGGDLYRDEDGTVPAWLGLEYMAQAVAVHGGLLDRAAGTPPRPGFFLGSRRLVFAADRFARGQALEVAARHLRGSASMLAFECSVREPGRTDPLVSGVLTVYLSDGFEALAEDFPADD